MAVRPGDSDLAKWRTKFDTLIEGVDARTRDPDVLTFTRRLHYVSENLGNLAVSPSGQQYWRGLREVAGIRMRESTPRQHVLWDEIDKMAHDGQRMAKALEAIREAHAPYCAGAQEPMTRVGDRWRCSDGANCGGRHWDFDGTVLEDPGSDTPGPAVP
jgi:hypothetical protein